MTKDEFLLHFNLQAPVDSIHNYHHHKPLKSAAVLIGLIDEGDGLHVLFTKRASHLRHHASQISFPGGKAEPDDTSLTCTALREAQEEIGLSSKAVTVIGQLDPYQVISGYHVTPIVAFIEKDQPYKKDDNEVAEIFQVPLQYFLADEHHHIIVASRNGQKHNIHFMPYKSYNIWGATASMLKDLVNHITPITPSLF